MIAFYILFIWRSCNSSRTSFLKNGGIVCSCTFSFGKFEFDFAETEDEVCKFTGSKYVKSNPEGVYKKILEKLKLGRKVLFVGLPCQVSAVRHYTKNHQNLYTADLILPWNTFTTNFGQLFV